MSLFYFQQSRTDIAKIIIFKLTSWFYFDYFVQVSSNLSDNGKHKILTNQSCLSLNFYHFLFIDPTCNCFSYFLSTLHTIVFLKHMHKDQVAVFILGISMCNLVLQSIKVCIWLNPFVIHYLGLIKIYLLICVFSRNSHNKYNTSLCFFPRQNHSRLRRSWFFR